MSVRTLVVGGLVRVGGRLSGAVDGLLVGGCHGLDLLAN